MAQLAQKLGTEFRVSAQTGSAQAWSAMASRGAGFVVSWQDDDATLGDTSPPGIKAQLFDANASRIGSEFLVNTGTVGGQYRPTVTGSPNANLLVAWVDLSSTFGDGSWGSIKGQLFDRGGLKIGNEFLVNSVTADDQFQPSASGLANGGFIVSWVDYSGTLGDSSGSSIKGQLFDGSGTKTGTEFLVNTKTSGNQYDAATTGLQNGNFLVTWYDSEFSYADATGWNVMGQLFDAGGGRIGSEFLVSTKTFQPEPTVTALHGGGFVISWSAGRVINGQVFDDTGTKVGDEFQANIFEWWTESANPTVTSLASGGFVIGWESIIYPTYTTRVVLDNEIKAQVFDGAGNKIGSEFLVNTQAAGYQNQPAVAGLADGSFVVSWTDHSSMNIEAQVFELGFADGAAMYHGDFNGDGRSDVLWRGEIGEVGLWQMNGSQIIAGDGLGNPSSYWAVVGIGDFNGDERSDVLWRGQAGEVGLWQMDGFRVVAGNGVSNPGDYWTVVGTGDFSGDGRSDILWRGRAGEVGLWQMNGSQIVAGNGLGNPGNYWAVAGTGDFNGDGRSDVLWRGQAGEVGLWEMNGFQVLAGSGVSNPGDYWDVVGTGDFSGDGRSDILWRGRAGEVGLWQMNGSQIVTGDGLGNPGNYWTVAGTGDFNGDGRSDVLWRGQAGEVGLWEMNGFQVVAGSWVSNPGDYWQVAG